MLTAAAAAAESPAARMRVLLLWAAVAQALVDLKAQATVALAVARALADLKAQVTVALADPEVLVVLEVLAAQVVLHRDLEAGEESASQRALLGQSRKGVVWYGPW